jgi:hypothetical protein
MGQLHGGIGFSLTQGLVQRVDFRTLFVLIGQVPLIVRLFVPNERRMIAPETLEFP